MSIFGDPGTRINDLAFEEAVARDPSQPKGLKRFAIDAGASFQRSPFGKASLGLKKVFVDTPMAFGEQAATDLATLGKSIGDIPRYGLPALNYRPEKGRSALDQAVRGGAIMGSVLGPTRPGALAMYGGLNYVGGTAGAALQGQSPLQANISGMGSAIEGVPRSLVMAGIGQMTNPLIERAGRGLPFIERNLIRAPLNVAEGIAMDRAVGYETTPSSMLLDAVMPIGLDVATGGLKGPIIGDYDIIKDQGGYIRWDPRAETLYHSSEDVFETGRPGFDAYFGNKRWKENFAKEFGPNEYEIQMPENAKILDLDQNTKEANNFIKKWGGTRDDFYMEDWVDKNKIMPEIKKLGYDGAKFGDEYLLTKEIINQPDIPNKIFDKNIKKMKWFRGEGSNIDGKSGDKFFSTSDYVAGDYGNVRPIKGDEIPDNILEAWSKEDLAETIGYKGDPRAEPLNIKENFDDLAKKYATKKGYKGIAYLQGTFDEPELHIFNQAKGVDIPKPTDIPKAKTPGEFERNYLKKLGLKPGDDKYWDAKYKAMDQWAENYAKKGDFIGIFDTDNKLESFNYNQAKEADFNHSFLFKDPAQYENDSVLRFVRNNNEDIYTINGGAVLDPKGVGQKQISDWARSMIDKGADPTMKVKVEDLALPKSEAPFQGKTLGTLEELKSVDIPLEETFNAKRVKADDSMTNFQTLSNYHSVNKQFNIDDLEEFDKTIANKVGYTKDYTNATFIDPNGKMIAGGGPRTTLGKTKGRSLSHDNVAEGIGEDISPADMMDAGYLRTDASFHSNGAEINYQISKRPTNKQFWTMKRSWDNLVSDLNKFVKKAKAQSVRKYTDPQGIIERISNIKPKIFVDITDTDNAAIDSFEFDNFDDFEKYIRLNKNLRSMNIKLSAMA